MRVRFQAVIAASLMMVAGLLTGCAEDYGVDQHGQKVTAEQLEGQWLVINYWADWCAPCRKEIPQLNLLADQQQGRGVRVLGVNFDGLQGEDLRLAAHELGIQFPVLQQDPAERLQLPRNEMLPVTYLLDPQGKVREQLLGEQTAAGLTARLAELRGQE